MKVLQPVYNTIPKVYNGYIKWKRGCRGGLADAIRYEKSTHRLVGGKSHIQKRLGKTQKPAKYYAKTRAITSRKRDCARACG